MQKTTHKSINAMTALMDMLITHFSCFLIIDLNSNAYIKTPQLCHMDELPAPSIFVELWKEQTGVVSKLSCKEEAIACDAIVMGLKARIFISTFNSGIDSIMYVILYRYFGEKQIYSPDKFESRHNQHCYSCSKINPRIAQNFDSNIRSMDKLQQSISELHKNRDIIQLLYFVATPGHTSSINDEKTMELLHNLRLMILNMTEILAIGKEVHFWFGCYSQMEYFLVLEKCDEQTAQYISTSLSSVMRDLQLLKPSGFTKFETCDYTVRTDFLNSTEVIEIMRKTIANQIFNEMDSNTDFFDKLTNREKEVAELLFMGYHNQDIASNLFISLPTVKKHVANILDKYEVNSRLELIAKYLFERD